MKKRSNIKLLRARFPALMLIVSLLLSLMFMSAGTAFGTSTPAGPQVTNFTVLSPATGNITRGTPVRLSVEIVDDRINTGSVNLANGIITAIGIPVSASFSGSNATTTANVGPTQSTYTLTFDLTYTGTGNTFYCMISYSQGGATLPFPIASTPPKPINQCVEYVPEVPPPPPPPVDPDPPPPPIPTDFILRDANYGSDTIYAGEPFTLTIVILATSGSAPVNNVSVSFTPPEQMTFVDGTSVVYIGRMQPGSTATVSANLMPNGNITEGSYTVSIKAEGFNADGTRLSAPMSVSIPVLQPERFEIFNAQLPTFLTAGIDDGTGFGSVTLVNKGQGAVSNVTVDVVGEGLSFSEGRQFIGNINGGAQSVADFMMRAEMPGRISALIVVTYENVRGDQKSLDYPFDIDVGEFMPPEIVDPGFPPVQEMPASAGMPTWGWILIIAGATIAASIILVQRRKKKLAAAEAALDDEDDD